jgi:Holliday junction resolvase RusA-like endonuclease
MPKVCAFVVYGIARPKGSTRSWACPVKDAHGQVVRDATTGRVVMRQAITHQNRESLMKWAHDIRAAIQLHAPELQDALVRGPVAVRIVFHLPKPKSATKKAVYPVVAPDVDKLARAALDPMTKTIFHDDAQVVGLEVWKVYTDGQAKAAFEVWTPDQLPTAIRESNPFQEALF